MDLLKSETKAVILIVDDNPANIQVLSHIFKANHKILVASGGARALELAAGTPRPNLILLDVMMPEMDGFEVCRRLKASERTRDIPVIFVTARNQPEDEEKGFQLGASDFITKPFSPAVVRARVSNLLNLQFRTDRLEHLTQEHKILLDNIQTQVWYLTDEMTYGMVNEAHAAFNGMSVADMAFKNMYDIFPKEVVEVCRVSNRDVFKTGRTVRTEEWVPHVSGAQRLISIVKTPHLGPDGAVDYIVASAEDITARKQAESALQASEARYRSLTEHLPGILYMFSSRRGGLFWSPQVQQILGYTPTDLLRDPFIWNNAIHPEDKSAVQEAITNFNQGAAYSIEYRIKTADGCWIWLHDQFIYKAVQDEDIIIEGYAVDITARREAEVQVRHLHKTESLGRMAGAIAHHFNNKLQGVIGNLDLVLGDSFQPTEPRPFLEAAMDSAREAVTVSLQLLAYLGKSPAQRQRFDLGAFCHHIQPLLQALIPSQIRLISHIPKTPRWIFGDKNQIQQVLTCLVSNAVEAMGSDSGNITLVLESADVTDIPASPRFPVTWRAESAEYVCLTVQDTGEGIPADAITRLTDPFYTTRFIGRGLGLPVSLGIVTAHGGVLTVESQPDQGSRFRIWLPAVAPEERQEPVSDKSAARAANRGVILVVESDPQIRRMLKRMLEHLEYGVLETANELEAIAIFKEQQATISAVLCDLNLAGQNARQTLQTLRAIAPKIGVILVSGLNETQVLNDTSGERPNAFLQKPFSIPKLQEALNKAISETELAENE